MSDIRCAICAEPWDSYGVSHGDMLPWETKLFQAGAGCPCCEGEQPAGVDSEAGELAHVKDALEHDDPHAFDRLNAILAASHPATPVWERPADPIVRACPCGKVEIKRNSDESDPVESLFWIGHYDRDDAPDEWTDETEHPAMPESEAGDSIAGVWCPRCVTTCDRCCESVAVCDTYPDPADEYRSHVVCYGCLEQIPTCGRCSTSTEDAWTDSQGDCEHCTRLTVWRDDPNGGTECDLVRHVQGKRDAERLVDSLAEDNPGVRFVASEERNVTVDVYENTESAVSGT